MAGRQIRQRVPADATQVPGLRHTAAAFAAAHCTHAADTRSAVALTVTEACTNVVRHAYPDRQGDLILSLWLDADHLYASITDHGVGIDAASRSTGLGFGLQLINTLAAARITSTPHGTHVELRFPRRS